MIGRFVALLCCCSVLQLAACSRQETPATAAAHRLQVVTTLFPLYDFARAIGGDRADVVLLLPPGVEPHSFEPKPDDIFRISQADIFVFTHRAMEPWAVRAAAGVAQNRVAIIDASIGTRLETADAGARHDHEDKHAGHGAADQARIDPHLWLDFDNARIMVGNLAAAMSAADPDNQAFYQANAAAYQTRLADLDARYRATLTDCETRVIVHGGHFTFGYLAHRYGLDYRAAAAVNPDAEPTPARLAELVKLMRANRLQHIFSEELVSPQLAATIARETGAAILPLNAAHNLSKAEFDRGTTFVEIMARNLDNLATGLRCR